jgi:hypothetical protein
MKILIPISVLLTLILPACGEVATYHASAPSEITVQVRPDNWVVHQKSVRYEVYAATPDDITAGVNFSPRLATITTVSDGETDDQTNRIDVTVDALSGGRAVSPHSPTLAPKVLLRRPTSSRPKPAVAARSPATASGTSRRGIYCSPPQARARQAWSR